MKKLITFCLTYAFIVTLIILSAVLYNRMVEFEELYQIQKAQTEFRNEENKQITELAKDEILALEQQIKQLNNLYCPLELKGNWNESDISYNKESKTVLILVNCKEDYINEIN